MRRYAVPVMLLTLAGCASSGGVLGPPHWNGPLPSRRNLRVAVEAAKARLVSAARSADSGAMAAGLVSDALLIAGGDTIRGATALQRYLERGRAAAPRGTLLFRDPVIDLCTDGALEVGSALVFLPQDTLSGGPTPQTPYAVRWVVDPAGVARISSIGFAATPAEQAPSIRRCEHTLDELRLWRRPLRLRIGTTLSTLKWQNFGGTLASRGYGRHPLGGRAVTKRFNQGAWLWAGATARIAGPVSVELLGGWRAYRTEVAGFRAADSSDILFTQTTSWAALSVDLQYRRLRLAAGPLAARSSWRLREQIWTFWNLYWWNDEPVAEERWSDWTIGTFVQASYGIPLIADRFFLDLSVQYRSAEARLRGTPRFPPSRLALRSTTAGIVMGIAL